MKAFSILSFTTKYYLDMAIKHLKRLTPGEKWILRISYIPKIPILPEPEKIVEVIDTVAYLVMLEVAVTSTPERRNYNRIAWDVSVSLSTTTHLVENEFLDEKERV